MFVGFATRGQGAVVMTNSDEGSPLVDEMLQAIAKEYGWPAYAPREIVALAIMPDSMRQYAGRYAMRGTPFELTVAVEDGRLTARQPGASPIEIVLTGADEFTPTISAPPFHFARDASGHVTALVVGGTRLERVP